MERLAVAYIVDERMLPGFLVSLHALDRFITHPIQVYVFISTFSRRIVNSIKKFTHADSKLHVCLLPTPHVTSKKLRKLQHSLNAYNKMMIPNFIKEKYVLYLDCDTIPLMDITQFAFEMIDRFPLGAVPTQKVKSCLDKEVVLEYGMEEKSNYFNSGVLFINTHLWRECRLSETCVRFAEKLGQRAISHDQTVLNIVFNGNFAQLEHKFNKIVSPRYNFGSFQKNSENILHFIGSPKPWEYLAGHLNPAASKWIEIARKLGHEPRAHVLPHSFAEAKNTLRLLRSTVINSRSARA